MCKKIFISFLLVAIFNLLVGCYSTNYVTYDELKVYKDNNNVIITTTDSREHILKRENTSQYYSDWEIVDNSIEWTESKAIFQKDNPKLGKYTTINTTIAEKEISKIEIQELNVLSTALLSVGIVAVAIIIIGALTWKGPNISLEGLKF